MLNDIVILVLMVCGWIVFGWLGGYDRGYDAGYADARAFYREEGNDE